MIVTPQQLDQYLSTTRQVASTDNSALNCRVSQSASSRNSGYKISLLDRYAIVFLFYANNRYGLTHQTNGRCSWRMSDGPSLNTLNSLDCAGGLRSRISGRHCRVSCISLVLFTAQSGQWGSLVVPLL